MIAMKRSGAHMTATHFWRKVGQSFAALLLLAAFGTASQAQNLTAGSITGTVKDGSGAVVPNATITVTNENTHSGTTVQSGSNGFYDAENLGDGEYSITVVLSGFQKTTINHLHLDPGQRRGQDFALKPGGAETQINVDADTVAVQTESAESGGTISSKEVANLMLNGRNFQQLATLVPGVSSVNGTNSQVNAGYLGQTDLIVGGASSEETGYTIDGVYNMTPTSLININITPSIDAINEMRVLKNSYSAKYGQAGSGQVVIDTKSGTRDFHGTGYEYVRNNSLGVARPYSITGVPATSNSTHYNIYGFTFGGPVVIPKLYNTERNKTFFFVGAEWKINHYASVLNSRSEFTQAMRNGDLSQSHDAQACPAAPTAASIAAGCTPATVGDHYLLCGTNCSSLLQARALSAAQCLTKDANGVTNQVQAACFDSASSYFINPNNKFMPLPNLPQNNNTSFANYINTNPELDSQNDTIYRVDQHIGQKHLVTLRYMHEEVYNIRPARNYNDPATNPGASVYTPAINMLARWNYNITPGIINSAGLAYTDQKVNLFPTGAFNIPAGTIKNVFANGDNRLPAVTIGNFWTWLGVGVQPNYSRTGDGLFSDDLTISHKSHTIQVGGLYMWNILRSNASAFSMGSFGFTGGAATTGDTAGDFLLGMAASYSQSNVQRTGVYHQHNAEFYAQDDWKVLPRLLFTYGVRYSYYSPSTKDGNDITNFVPSAWNAAVAPAISPTTGAYIVNGSNQPLTSTGAVANYATNGVVQACTNGVPCGFTVPKKGLFAPRVGFAYRLNEAGTRSVHGGYGIGYTQVGLFETSNLVSNNPYVSTPTYNYVQFSTPGGGAANAPGVQSLTAVDNTYRPAMMQNWSLSYEDEIVPHGILNITYAGNKVDHIFSTGVDRNFPFLVTSANSATCAASSPSASPSSNWQFDPCLNTTPVVENSERPYLGYSGITSGVSIGQSNYNGLQTGFIYRLHDLQLNEAYTFSKALGNQNQNAAGSLAYGFDSNIGFQNPHNPGLDYGRPSYDRPHVFTSAAVYSLPFFRHSNLIAKELLSGYGLSTLITAQSGFVQSVGLSTPTNGLANRPNQIAPLVRHSGSGKHALGQAPLYSFASFAQPAYGTFGNSEPGVLRGPREVSAAAAINKNIPITDRAGLVLRAEAFNLFNHPNINSFNSTWSNVTSTNQSNFGYAQTAGDMRQMEFSVRVNF